MTQTRTDERRIPTQSEQQERKDRAFPDEHGGARTMHAEIQKHAENIEKRCAQKSADEIGDHVAERFALRTKEAAERQRTAEHRRTQADVTRIDCAAGEIGCRAEQRKHGRGKEQTDDKENTGNRQRRKKADGRGTEGEVAVSAAQRAADGTACAHAEREADGLLQRGQREACADGGGEPRIRPAQNQRFEQAAQG